MYVCWHGEGIYTDKSTQWPKPPKGVLGPFSVLGGGHHIVCGVVCLEWDRAVLPNHYVLLSDFVAVVTHPGSKKGVVLKFLPCLSALDNSVPWGGLFGSKNPQHICHLVLKEIHPFGQQPYFRLKV